MIEGHIKGERWMDDGLDEDTKEKKLSLNRAKCVNDFLIKKGIDASRLNYIGMKAKFPSLKGPNFDRRVEIVLDD
jgi:outer membrane protein OmpA-like peptidoglycan-associated protein